MNFDGELQNFHPKTSIIFNDVSNDTQICYHLVYPKNFNLIKKPKRTIQVNRELNGNKRRRRGRPRKEDAKKPEELRRTTEETTNNEKSDESILKLSCSRTRSGRVSRPPKHMSKFVDIKDARMTGVTETNTSESIVADINQVNITNEIAATNNTNENNSIVRTEPKKIRKNVDRFTCSVCKKVIKARMVFEMFIETWK